MDTTAAKASRQAEKGEKGESLSPLSPYKEFLSVPELAALMSVTPKTAEKWVERGKVPSARVGGTRRIRRRDIDEIFEKAKLS